MKLTTFLLLILFFLTISPDPGFSQDSLKVGALVPFTGRWGDSGRECARGLLDAGKWINQRGGIYGKKLEIILIDDSSQPAEFVAAFRKLNEADRILLLYLYSTETGLALLPHINLQRIPTLTSSFPVHLADTSKTPYLFSITPTPLDLAKIAMKFISERSDIKMRKPKVVFISFPDPSGKYFLDEAKSHAKTLGLEIGPDIFISDISFLKPPSPVLAPLKSYHPDFAYLNLTSKEAAAFLQEVRGMDLKTRWICNMRAFDETLSAFDGVLGVQPISPFGEDVPGMAEIKEAHQKWHPYDSHTLSYVEGWVTVKVMAEALGRSLPEQGFSRERVRMAFEGFKNYVVGGLLPPLNITAKDHRPSVESRIFIVKDGKLLRHTGFISVGR
ncbi:MAG: ABC transporter substrate-binding protein [Thermodesulfobacteriota bacterium]|nr:ABC transporter substrate-binding protein [Thermodesulfobacteriota bacterium]